MLTVIASDFAATNPVSCSEALTVAAGAGLDLHTAHAAIRISSGTSAVHETESQGILNGSRDIDSPWASSPRTSDCFRLWPTVPGSSGRQPAADLDLEGRYRAPRRAHCRPTSFDGWSRRWASTTARQAFHPQW
jgi:hypothetical protein